MRKIDNYLFARTNGMEIRLIEMELSKNATRTLVIEKSSEDRRARRSHSGPSRRSRRKPRRDAAGRVYDHQAVWRGREDRRPAGTVF